MQTIDDLDLPRLKTQTSKNSESGSDKLGSKVGNLSKTPSTAPIIISDSSAQDDEPDMSYEAVVSKYILQHDRSPPKGFDKWVKYAKEKKCYLNHYDPIYRDLAPYMSLTVEQFRHRLELAKKAPRTSAIEIMNGQPKNGNSLIDRVNSFRVYLRQPLNLILLPSSLCNSFQT